jgi:hypothetical protein
LFTGGWITASSGEGVDKTYTVEIYGSEVAGLVPTDFYDYSIGGWVYLLKNVNSSTLYTKLKNVHESYTIMNVIPILNKSKLFYLF